MGLGAYICAIRQRASGPLKEKRPWRQARTGIQKRRICKQLRFEKAPVTPVPFSIEVPEILVFIARVAIDSIANGAKNG
jgi:hypothetical protein